MNDEIVKCLNCGHVLISGSGMMAIFGPGTSIQCINCGNKYVFGSNREKKSLEDKNEIRNLPKS